LPLTGERTVPGIPHENYWFQRHVVAYAFAAQRAGGKVVLDAGCGEGYGVSMLAGVAKHVTGVDLDRPSIVHARAAYPHAEFVEGNLVDLPLDDGGVDLVTSFQVIEHLWDIPAYLAEIARVLRPAGEFLCATPNRLTFTPDSDTPVNPFHTVEFSPAELTEALGRVFRVSALLGVHHGRRLRAVERLARKPLPDLQLERPPAEWPRWLRRTVTRVRPTDFRLRADRLAHSLDLLAVGVKP
jgi:SAM-dependent methyltransferase